MEDVISLSSLLREVKGRIGVLSVWTKAEIASCKFHQSGHIYLDLIEKSNGMVTAKARAMIWSSDAYIVDRYMQATGKEFGAGMSIVAKVVVSYHEVYGVSLTIKELDGSFSIGERELEKRRTIERITKEGLPALQEKLPLPYLPKRLAVISSEDAAGFGDFVRHLGDNPYGFKYDCVLVPALMQGEYAAQSIADALWEAGKRSVGLDYVLILRGGGADTDLYCYDEYVLASAIAKCPVPVLTAIGHDKDYHIADMVAKMHFKTPTALAEAIIGFTAERENEMLSAVACLRLAFSSRIERMQYALELAQSNIENADPRRILKQGYLLARGKDGKVVKKASAAGAGEDFSLLFNDGEWACRISEVKLKTRSNNE